jgi:hypothetical protein
MPPRPDSNGTPDQPAKPAARRTPPASVWISPHFKGTDAGGDPAALLPCARWITGRIASHFHTRIGRYPCSPCVRHGGQASLMRRGKKPHAASDANSDANPVPLAVLCDWHERELESGRTETLIASIAGNLAPKALLVVLTRIRGTGDVFENRCGHLISHARAASLVYLQHIIAVHPKPTPHAGKSPATGNVHENPAHHRMPHPITHTDILVFSTPGMTK